MDYIKQLSATQQQASEQYFQIFILIPETKLLIPRAASCVGPCSTVVTLFSDVAQNHRSVNLLVEDYICHENNDCFESDEVCLLTKKVYPGLCPIRDLGWFPDSETLKTSVMP